MKKIFIVLFLFLFLVNYSIGSNSNNGKLIWGETGGVRYLDDNDDEKEEEIEEEKILVKGKLYSKEWINNNFLVLEERIFSFGSDYLIYHEKTKTAWGIRKEPNQTKYHLLQEWETYKDGRYIKSMKHLGYYFDLKHKRYINYWGN